jgi:1-deoxy-D-xylulose-5-phosphate reductoisomerase
VGKNIVILGSTGSIGQRTLDVVEALGDGWRIVGLAAGSNWRTLAEQARKFRPRRVVLSQDRDYARLKETLRDLPIEVAAGPAAVEELAEAPDADFVLCAIVGAQSLLSVLRAIEAGKNIGLASKEALVLGGPQVMARAREKSVAILPVDSEHSAIFQALQAGRSGEVRRIILTASGGPFRQWDKHKIRQATLDQALEHPTWSMGKKITIDSATMMNKALEIIEAHHLFGVGEDKISVLIHPESIVHSLVEFCDGSVIGQFSVPDMAIPIQLALTWPDRRPCIGEGLDLARISRLHFYEPDFEKFPALRLAYEVARRGGTAGAVFNAANERAVELFVAGKIRFGEIVETIERVLQRHEWIERPSLEDLLQADQWARNEVKECICNC